VRFEASRWEWTRTRTGRRLLVAAVAVSLAAFLAGPWVLEPFAVRDTGGALTVLVLAASLLVSWPFWVLSQLGLWFLLAPTGSSRSPWSPSWPSPGRPGRGW
jgi:hypothetical protein